MNTRRARVIRWEESPAEVTDELAIEEPLEIRIGGEPTSVTMRTPGNDPELVSGFLLSEGFLAKGALPMIRHIAPNVVDVLSSTAKVGAPRATIASTSCGLCGKASIASVHQNFPPVESTMTITRNQLMQMVAKLESAQSSYSRTGGLHAAAIFDDEGNLLSAYEDVGRHNAVDKCIGSAVLRRQMPLTNHVLLVSSRASFEIMQKALSASVPVVAVVSAPSSLAVEFAESSNQTLIGFLRPGRCNVYSHAERVLSYLR